MINKYGLMVVQLRVVEWMELRGRRTNRSEADSL